MGGAADGTGADTEVAGTDGGGDAGGGMVGDPYGGKDGAADAVERVVISGGKAGCGQKGCSAATGGPEKKNTGFSRQAGWTEALLIRSCCLFALLTRRYDAAWNALSPRQAGWTEALL